ncbi:MAG: 5'/3'-nucleotidase SurE [Thermoleophilia bacterium]|nr:5'/3'-nucleotidase SurE [Thermoleophilia bacterium]
MKVLVTNDDGITSPGIFSLKKALETVAEVAVIAPDRNCSAIGRGITVGESMDVEEIAFPDGGTGFAVCGTPVDCVRLASLGFLDWRPDMVVSGINLGVNLGDDITYSGTVAAAFEGIMLGIPAIAASIERSREQDYNFETVADFTARLAERIVQNHLPENILLNINSPNRPAAGIRGAEVTHLGKRIYRDQLVEEVAGDGPGGRRRYHIYGDDPSYHKEEGTDFHAINLDKISVTPIHFALTNVAGLKVIRDWDLDTLIGRNAGRVNP